MMTLTYWEHARIKRTPDDYDEIETVALKSVKQVPELILEKPANCAMVSTQHSADRKLKNGTKTNFFKEVWREGQQLPPVYQLNIYDKEDGFRVTVLKNGQVMQEATWSGREHFTFQGEEFALLGPYQGFEEFRLYKLTLLTKD